MTEEKKTPQVSVWKATVPARPAVEPERSQDKPIDFERLIKAAKAVQDAQRSKASVRAAREMEAVRLLQV